MLQIFSRHYACNHDSLFNSYRVISSWQRCGYKDTHITVGFNLLRGQYDDDLQWPFEADIVIELLNWREEIITIVEAHFP